MEITFGIITSGLHPDYIENIINSIESENIPIYEIIVVGGTPHKYTTHINFDESIKDKWITRKKNLITQNAKYENIVYLHDYIKLMPGWYKANIDFGNNWDILMTRIINHDGTRFRDWTLWDWDVKDKIPGRKYLLPYDVTHLSDKMYISGAYWMAKKYVMEEYPLNEALCWAQGEDVEWSLRVRNKYKFSINPNAAVMCLKQKETYFSEITHDELKSFLL